MGKGGGKPSGKKLWVHGCRTKRGVMILTRTFGFDDEADRKLLEGEEDVKGDQTVNGYSQPTAKKKRKPKKKTRTKRK